MIEGLEECLQVIGIGLIMTALMNMLVQLYLNNPLCDNHNCEHNQCQMNMNSSMDSLYENYFIGTSVLNIFFGIPSSLLFLTSGILCLTGPLLAVITISTLTAILLVIFSICIFVALIREDDFLFYNWLFNSAAQIVGIILSISASVCGCLKYYSE